MQKCICFCLLAGTFRFKTVTFLAFSQNPPIKKWAAELSIFLTRTFVSIFLQCTLNGSQRLWSENSNLLANYMRVACDGVHLQSVHQPFFKPLFCDVSYCM